MPCMGHHIKKRLEAIIAAKGASTKYRAKAVNTCVHVISQFCFVLFMMSLWGVVCRIWKKKEFTPFWKNVR